MSIFHQRPTISFKLLKKSADTPYQLQEMEDDLSMPDQKQTLDYE
jgi:hypothetical protein